MCFYTQTTYTTCKHNRERLLRTCPFGDKYRPGGHDKVFEFGSLKTVEDNCPACGGPAEVPLDGATQSPVEQPVPVDPEVVDVLPEEVPLPYEQVFVDLTAEDEDMLDLDDGADFARFDGPDGFDDGLKFPRRASRRDSAVGEAEA